MQPLLTVRTAEPELILFQLGADDAQTAGVVRRAAAHLMLLGHIVEVQPLAAVGGRDDTLGPQDRAVFAAVQRRQDALQLRLGVPSPSPCPSW